MFSYYFYSYIDVVDGWAALVWSTGRSQSQQ